MSGCNSRMGPCCQHQMLVITDARLQVDLRLITCVCSFLCFYAILGHWWDILPQDHSRLTVIGSFCRSNVSDRSFWAINSDKMEPPTPSPMTTDVVALSRLVHQLLLVTFEYFYTYQTYSPAGGFSFCMKFKLKKHLWCLKIEQSIPALLKPNLGHKTKMNIIILPPNPKTDSQTLYCMGLTTSLKI